MSEQIYEADEYCEKCLGVENVGKWVIGDTDLYFPMCDACFNDKESLQKWFAAEMENVLRSNPDEWEELPDGKWQKKILTVI